MRLLALLSLVFVVAGLPVLAADYYDGLAAFKAGDYETAFENWKPLADAGFPEAQYQLARMYHRGYAVQDDFEAARLYRLAAEQNHTMAQNNLGVMYEQGRGVERDEAEAARWYLKAARQGLVVAQANVAVLYDEGRGVDADPGTAAEWYRLAGDAGHATSQYRMALLFESGRGVERNDRKAAAWFKKAAKQGHAESQLALSRMYQAGRGVKKDPSKAAKWSRRAMVQGLDASRIPEPEEAEAQTSPPPPAGVPTAAAATQEPSASPERADAAMKDAEPRGEVPDSRTTTRNPDAAARAVPVPPPVDETLAPALAGTFDAAEAGDVDAQYELARRFEIGDGLPISPQEAGKWYLAAAERGHGFAGYKLAFQYFRGRGIAKGKDMQQAYFWFRVSDERGVGDSKKWVERTAKKLGKGEIAEVEAKLEEWKRR